MEALLYDQDDPNVGPDLINYVNFKYLRKYVAYIAVIIVVCRSFNLENCKLVRYILLI